MSKSVLIGPGPRCQRGAATLFVAVFLLLAVTVTVIFSAQTAFFEQRMFANELRAKQAAAAAQAGLEQALDYLAGSGNNPAELFPQNFDVTTNDPVFRARFFDVDALPPACPEDPTAAPFSGTLANVPPDTRRLILYSCGWSDDRSARKVAIQEVRAGPALGSPPNVPLVSQSVVDTRGRARAYNLFGNFSVWTGGDLDVDGNPGTTFIRNPDEPFRETIDWSTETLPTACRAGGSRVQGDYYCSSDQNEVGLDVVQNDKALASLGSDDFFLNFLGLPRTEYETTTATVITADALIQRSTDTSNPLGGQVFWINANAGETIDLGNAVLGSQNNPLVLVINGPLKVTAQFRFYGVIYVAGDLTAVGGPKFYGSTIVEGEVAKAGGNPDFIFDPNILANASGSGRRVGLYGTWRNWVVVN